MSDWTKTNLFFQLYKKNHMVIIIIKMRENEVKKIHRPIAVTRIRTWVVAATTQSTNHYTITATKTC